MEKEKMIETLHEVEKVYRVNDLGKVVAKLTGQSLSMTTVRIVLNSFMGSVLPRLDSWNQGKIKAKVETFINAFIVNNRLENGNKEVMINVTSLNWIISEFVIHVARS